MRPRALVGTLLGAVVATTVLAGAAQAIPATVGSTWATAGTRWAPATLVGGGGRQTATLPDALPESDRRTQQTATRTRAVALPERHRVAAADRLIDIRQRAALRSAGWSIPAKLAGSWVLRHARVVDGDPGTVQLVYSRGAGTLSVFQQATPLDVSSLPEGSTEVAELPGTVREWPRAEPPRLVWQARDRTYLLVGDGRRDALVEAAGDLPPADTESTWHRVRRGLHELVERLRL